MDPQAPYLRELLARAYPAAVAEDDGGPAVHLVPQAAFEAERLLPLLEGPVNGLYYRIEQPDEGVMMFAFDERKLACWATTEPARWLGFDPRDEIVHEAWDDTFESTTMQERATVSEEPGSAGAAGRGFEGAFISALHLLELGFEQSLGWSAQMWDIRPAGLGWHRLISDLNVNLKVTQARHAWTAGGSALYKSVHAQVAHADDGTITRTVAEARITQAVERMLKATGARNTVFLKPKDAATQHRIIAAAKRKDVAALRNLLTQANFASKRLGRSVTIKVYLDWEKDDAGALMDAGVSPQEALRRSWQGSFNVYIDGGVEGSSFGITGRIDYKGGIFTVAFRDRQGKPAMKKHAARVSEGAGGAAIPRWLRDEARKGMTEDARSSIRRERKPGEGSTSIYGGVRFHKGHNKTRKPRKDVQLHLQNRMNARRGTGKRIQAAKQWHRSHKGAEMHRALSRYNRDNNPRGAAMRERIADVRARIAKWQADMATRGYVGESTMSFGAAQTSYNPQNKTLDDIFEGLLRKLIVMEALDILQDVEFDDSGAIYLFFDPSIPGEEMDEVVLALQAEQNEIALVASPNRSLPGEDVDSEWWVMFLPGKGEDGQPSVPDSRVYSTEQEPGSKVQMVTMGPPVGVDQLAQGIDVKKILKAAGGK